MAAIGIFHRASAARAEKHKYGTNIPCLETPRLILRQLSVADAPSMFEYSHRADVTRFLLWDPHPTEAFTRRYLRDLQEKYRSGTYYDWGLELQDTGKLIGTCGFVRIDRDHSRAEIGYVLHPDYWFLGLAAEAVGAVLAYGFVNLHLQRIEARYMVGNDASRRVMEKCGMTFEGIQRSAVFAKNAYHDVGVCAITRDDYFNPERK